MKIVMEFQFEIKKTVVNTRRQLLYLWH